MALLVRKRSTEGVICFRVIGVISSPCWELVMLRSFCCGLLRNYSFVKPLRFGSVRGSARTFCEDQVQSDFDVSLLDFLVCPLSKKPLRYEAQTNELVNDELGIAYPIIDGIPNMIPQEARLLQKDPPPTQE
ncbi:protein preY, mitochondrial-like [Synchiropus splendidus]|uniref:protein preY, mitochondrial-like n=1 Tax=Synchiropus splendidus TaxID=270530 RepID=UPI00237DF9DF|nr:protein preY, mitochondrial-like [Synchiropus splendidus]